MWIVIYFNEPRNIAAVQLSVVGVYTTYIYIYIFHSEYVFLFPSLSYQNHSIAYQSTTTFLTKRISSSVLFGVCVDGVYILYNHIYIHHTYTNIVRLLGIYSWNKGEFSHWIGTFCCCWFFFLREWNAIF